MADSFEAIRARGEKNIWQNLEYCAYLPPSSHRSWANIQRAPNQSRRWWVHRAEQLHQEELSVELLVWDKHRWHPFSREIIKERIETIQRTVCRGWEQSPRGLAVLKWEFKPAHRPESAAHSWNGWAIIMEKVHLSWALTKSCIVPWKSVRNRVAIIEASDVANSSIAWGEGDARNKNN